MRGLVLYALGVLYGRGLGAGWEEVRLLGVLQRIALGYTVTALLFLRLRPRGLAITAAALLVGYWAAMTFVPIRDLSLAPAALAARHVDTPAAARALYDQTTTWVTGHFEPGLNLANHVDFRWLPGRKYDGHYDPEGLLSTLPAIATCLLGALVGLLLRRTDLPDEKKIRWLVAAGVAAIALGGLWALQFPIVKKLWTSSFVLVTAGCSCLLVALFHQVIERAGYRRWATPFLWLGTNALTAYLARDLVDFDALAERLVGGGIKAGLGPFGEPLVAAVSLALTLALLRFLYRRRIFLRL